MPSWMNYRPVLVVAIIICFALAGFKAAEKNVIIEDDGKAVETVSTHASKVGDLLKQEGIELGPQDIVEPALDENIKDGSEVSIMRAFDVQVIVEGEKREITTCKNRVEDILAGAGIPLGENHVVRPSLKKEINEPGVIRVSRVDKEHVTIDEKIPHEVINENDANLARGSTRVKQKGADGLKRKIVEVTFVDGEETERKLVETKIVRQPRSKIVAKGTKTVNLASRGGTNLRYRKAMTAKVTAYTATGRRTATGTKPRVGTIAVDPRVIPLGTRLYVDGYGYGVAQDTGGSIVGNKIDVFMESQAAARNWGVRTKKVFVLE
ncbi:MAG: DUF348 domain-containing protein [Clostridia bacterium]|nr:DUF348 domain-containing protein [Clostridia bacterium]